MYTIQQNDTFLKRLELYLYDYAYFIKNVCLILVLLNVDIAQNVILLQLFETVFSFAIIY